MCSPRRTASRMAAPSSVTNPSRSNIHFIAATFSEPR